MQDICELSVQYDHKKVNLILEFKQVKEEIKY